MPRRQPGLQSPSKRCRRLQAIRSLRPRSTAELSWAALFANDLERALTHARTAAELSEPIDDAEVAAQAFDCLLYMELTAGIPSRPELIERALELEREAKHMIVELSQPRPGFQLCATGDLAAARAHLVTSSGSPASAATRAASLSCAAR